MYDVIIIGAGPAGLTASIYTSRYKLSNAVLGRLLGGTITYAHNVENYPGFLSVSGTELATSMIKQAKALGGEVRMENVVSLEKKGALFVLTTDRSQHFEAQAVIVTAGTERRKLNIPGETDYLGKGVSYCANCDAPFFKGKSVAVVGGGNAACSGATHVVEYAHNVYLIYRKSTLPAEPVWVEEVTRHPKIEVIYETNIKEILGNDLKVTGVRLDKPYRGSETLPVDGIFIEIGGVPASSFLTSLGVETDEAGYVKVNEKMETNIPGVFAAGDLTTHGQYLQQTVTACGAGAVAAHSAFLYLKSKK